MGINAYNELSVSKLRACARVLEALCDVASGKPEAIDGDPRNALIEVIAELTHEDCGFSLATWANVMFPEAPRAGDDK